jgi:branched-chain amino acid transport system substrate-binding protein
MKKTRVLAVVTAVAISTASFVAVAPSASAACSSYKLIFQGGITGDASQTGIGEYNGFKFAIKKFTDANPTVKVTGDVIDTQADPAQSPALATNTVKDECVLGVVGGMYSGETRAALPIYLAAGLPVISPSATAVDLPSVGKSVFHRIVANDDVQGPALAKLASNNGNRVYVVDDSSTYGKGLADIVRGKLGKKLVGSDAVTTGATNFSSIVAKIKKAKATVVFYGGYYPEASKFVKQLRTNTATKNIKFLGGDGVLDNQFIKLAGKYAEGVSFTAPYQPMGDVDKKLATEYKAFAGVDPAVYTLETYNATSFFLAGIKAGKITRADLNTYVSSTAFKAVGQTVKFGTDGEPSTLVMNEFIVKKGVISYVGAIK